MSTNFIQEIENILSEKSLLKHPFYKMWSEGKLSLEALKGYAAEYYTLEAAFPELLLKTRKYSPDKEDDKVLMENYAEETAKGKSHVDLWLDFSESLGLKRAEVKNSKPLASTNMALKNIESLIEKDYLSGIGALLSYEANLQETSATKIEGLKKYYGLASEKSTAFFSVHGILDIKHSNDWKDVLSKNAKTEKQQKEVKQAVEKSMNALWSFLDGIHEKYNAGSAC
jgi:pyrroloquinoline-quinone synthase